MPESLRQTEIRLIVESAGGRYVGVLRDTFEGMETIVLFVSPQTRTTLSIPFSCLTVEAVREQIAESDVAFARPGSKCKCANRNY
jgi:hypothetical protein